MIADLIVALALWLIGYGLFGRFIAPRWKIFGKLVFYSRCSDWSLVIGVDRGAPTARDCRTCIVVYAEWHQLADLSTQRQIPDASSLGGERWVRQGAQGGRTGMRWAVAVRIWSLHPKYLDSRGLVVLAMVVFAHALHHTFRHRN